MPLDFWPLANADRLAWDVVADVVAPPPPADFTAWAQRHVVFGEESPFPGPYDPDRFPYFRPVLEALSPDDPCRVVTLMGSAQIGKSVLCEIFVAASMDLDPCQAIYYHPTETNATEWARLKWKPLLRKSERLLALFGAERSRDGTQSTLFYERLDGRGSLTVAGANSGPALSMKSAKRQVQDDLAKWETLPSGDSETQADSRSSAFVFAKILKASTPLVEPGCRITANFKAGTQEHVHVPCRSCGVYQTLEWENMLAAIDDANPDDAHFTCVACQERIERADLDWMLDNCRVEAHNPGARERSFYVWSAYVRGGSWATIVHKWIKARGNPPAEQAFLNDTVGLAYKADGEAPPWESIRDRANELGHRLGVIPHGGLIFVAGCDCQKNRVEVHLKAFGRDGRRWTVEYRVIEGHISTDSARAALDKLIEETWPDEYGNDRRLALLAIDGNAWTDDVLQWARRHSWFKVIVTRGANSETAPPLAPVRSERKPDGRARKVQRRFFNLGVSAMKATLYVALAKTDPLARAFCAYPKGLEDDFFQQLCSERRAPHRGRDGFTRYRWEKEVTQANEVLDTELIAEGAAIRCGWRALTDKQADDREAMLIASGAANRPAAHPDLFDPANPPPPTPDADGEHRSPAEVRAAEETLAARAAAAGSPANAVRASAAGARRVIRSGYMGN